MWLRDHISRKKLSQPQAAQRYVEVLSVHAEV